MQPTRRDTLRVLGAVGVTAVVGCADEAHPLATAGPDGGEGGAGEAGAGADALPAAPGEDAGADLAPLTPDGAPVTCVVRPEQTEGPYFVDERLERADIRSDPGDGVAKPGVPLALVVRVFEVGGQACAPIAGAMVDVWQCDALGVYSDAQDASFDTRGKKFLRGYQLTDAAGAASFVTIYPGWYPGRAVHIHFKVRARDAQGARVEFTSQLYFPEAVSDEVFTQAPYAAGRRTTNAQDGVFRAGGSELVLAVSRAGAGYAGSLDLGLRLS